MLPVLFTIAIPAGWGLPVAVAVAVLVAALRAAALAWWPGVSGSEPKLSVPTVTSGAPGSRPPSPSRLNIWYFGLD